MKFVGAFFLAAVIAVSYLFWLSGTLGVRPGTAVTSRVDVVFGSDLSDRVHNLSGSTDATRELRERPYSVSHPLLNQLWGTPGGWLERRLRPHYPGESHLIAARILVALVAGCGIAAMGGVAIVSVGWRALPLLAIYLLFSVQVLVSLPEHMGLSNGALSLAFAAALPPLTRWRTAGLIVGGGAAAATTITNAAAPLLAIACRPAIVDRATHLLTPLLRWRAAVIVGVVATLAAATLVVGQIRARDTVVTRFINVRLAQGAPAIVNVLTAVTVYPAVAPSPRITGAPHDRHLSYEPLSLRDFDVINGTGAIAWLVLLVVSVRRAWTTTRPREIVLMPLGWLVFNTLFHSVWGDEFFLYTPHWSWALMGLVMLGVGGLSAPLVLGLTTAIGIGQVHTLRLILAALDSLGR